MTTEFARNGKFECKKHTVYIKKYTKEGETVYELTREATAQMYLTSNLVKPIREYFNDAFLQEEIENQPNFQSKGDLSQTIKKKGPGKPKNMLSFLVKKE